MERTLLPKEKAFSPMSFSEVSGGVSYLNNMFNASSEHLLAYESPPMLDPTLLPFGFPSPQAMLYTSFDGLVSADQNHLLLDDSSHSSFGRSYEKTWLHQTSCESFLPSSFSCDAGCASYEASPDMPRSLPLSIEEKMLRALSALKERYGGGILAQVWVPVVKGEEILLTTAEQPYLLDQALAGFREVSRSFSFSAGMKPGAPLGLPGRVFLSKAPEWTSNVIYYRDDEYLRVKHAVNHEVRGSIAFPIIDPEDNSCCAVLELAYAREKSDFHVDLDNVCSALSAVNLRTTSPPRLSRKSLTENETAALEEIRDVLRAVCHAHRLPLALTWVPCLYVDNTEKVYIKDDSSLQRGKSILCIEKSACYVNDKSVEGFVTACLDTFIEEGQGIAGRALCSNHPYFFADVKSYDISEYPLVHHARKYELQAAVAIKLRSTYTGRHDYVLEFFLPANISGSIEQQHLLNNLSGTMQRICKSLRTVSDSELECAKPQILLSGNVNFSPVKYPDPPQESAPAPAPAPARPNKISEKKKSGVEKTVSLNCLRQYFSGSLKDAAKSIGVCPTTLKRICRQHGIARWPSRKINKVNRSLRKIQNVLDSVQGVEGGLKFDPYSGGFVAASSSIQNNASKGEMNLETEEEAAAKVEDENQGASSSMTDSSNGSESLLVGSSSSSQSFGRRKSKEDQIAVKVTYNEDMVRFRFDRAGACVQLYEDVRRRFQLRGEAFQLKYLDDEDEWVMLVTDSDLQECLEVMELSGKHSVKLMVRDLPLLVPTSATTNLVS